MEKQLTTGLDYYKPTMSQLHYEHNRDTEVTFTFKNRGNQRLLDYIDPEALQDKFNTIQQNGWTQPEINHLADLKRTNDTQMFSEGYLNYLATQPLPEVNIQTENDDIAIQTTGEAPLVTFWETIVMAEVNEMYFENYLQKQGINPEDVYADGDRRLDKKIAILQANPDIKFSEFGTRRHFSYKWQHHIVQRLLTECPDNFLGTSNVAIAADTNTTPIGTFAHEMPMIYAGIADARGEDIKESHNKFLKDWQDFYGNDLSTALTDTFGSEFFFTDLTPQQAQEWKALRHDSGDPFDFGERVIDFYNTHGINPQEKTIVFSDGLDIDTITELHKRFNNRIGNVYGWGTTLTNDLGLKPLNIVMKATHVRIPDTGQEADLVKLSDNKGKHTGPIEQIRKYQQVFNVGKTAVNQDIVIC